ncbi:MAG: hypothetical protein Q9162_001941 [Coniocarpon cinnabarinum]
MQNSQVTATEGALPSEPSLHHHQVSNQNRDDPAPRDARPPQRHDTVQWVEDSSSLGIDEDQQTVEAALTEDDDRTYVPSIFSLNPSQPEQAGLPRIEGEEGENVEPSGFQRSNSPFKVTSSGTSTVLDGQDTETLHRMHKFSLYETLTRYFLVGSDVLDQRYRVLKIDRTAPPGQLSITEDETVYSKREVNQLLNTIENGNRGVGGMRYRGTSWGLLGFIRFTEAYYMLLIKKKLQVATIGGHYIFQIEDTDLIPLTTGSSSNFRGNRNAEENRFLSILGNLDLHPIDVFGRNIYITIIARRSRFFAGARFLKRGANDLGYVANDVETEQIAADMLVTSFNAPRLRQLRNPNYTSYVQHRGSIPLYWTQDSSGVSPKPAIDLNLIDPFYSTAALHFDNLFSRYQAPVYVLNLIKARERTPRERKLLVEYENAIEYLNQSLPSDKKIRYRAYDMSRAAKTRGQDVIGTLEKIADDIVRTTGFFQNDGQPEGDGADYVQNGVVRSNCIDCLDRTNAAQFVIGKRALAWQLQAMGVIASDTGLNYDSDANNLFAHMFNDQGDTLASQYGGSHLVNTTDSYRKINNWQSHSRDMLESFKRYYHNSFLDSQRQEAYNLFLGNYIYVQGQPMLWDLSTDYHLHHTDPRKKQKRRDYISWFTPRHLEPVKLPAVPDLELQRVQALRNDWWDEYYRPTALTSYHKLFAWGMNSTARYLPKPSQRPSDYDLSPFSVRKNQDLERASSRDELSTKQPSEADNTLTTASSNVPTPLSATNPPHVGSKRVSSLQKWLYPSAEDDNPQHASVKIDKSEVAAKGGKIAPKLNGHTRHKSARSSTFDDDHEARIIAGMKEFRPSNKQLMNQWTLAQFHANSLNPSVSENEVDEYGQYLVKPESLYNGYVSFPNPDTGFAKAKGQSKGHQAVRREASEENKDEVFQNYIDRSTQGEPASVILDGTQMNAELKLEEEMVDYLRAPQSLSLSVTAEDMERKRYQAYAKYMRGKAFFKQSTVDPEARMGVSNGETKA